MTSWRERKLIVATPMIERKRKTKGSSKHPHLDGAAAPSIVPDAQPLLAGTIIAELTGDDVATADGYLAKAPAPVLALCRILVNAGFDPARPLIAYRGPVLALRVRSISEGASLVVKSDAVGIPRFRKTVEIPDAAPAST